MKKILYFVTQSNSGGAQRYVYDLSSNFSKNYMVKVVSGEQGNTGELAIKLQKNRIDYIYLKHIKRAINPYHDCLGLWQIIKLLKHERPDIIHLNSTKISILGSMAGKIYHTLFKRHADVKIIYTVHGWVFNEDINTFKKSLYKMLERWSSHFKNQIICLSADDKQNAIKNNIVPKDGASAIYVIPNGRKPIEFLSREQARTHLGIKADAIIIGSIGNLYSNKGYEYVLQALQKINTSKIHLFIIGEGPERKHIESQIQQLNLNTKVTLYGSLANASSYLKAFDIYVCSSTKEGMPYTIIEAMQAGLPIISTKTGGIPGMITHKKNGLLMDIKNSAQLAENINYLLTHSDIASQLGIRAQKDALNNFSLSQMLDKTNKIYNL